MTRAWLAGLVLLLWVDVGVAQTWFLPAVFPNYEQAWTHKLAGVETVGSGGPVYWIPTLESDFFRTGRWSRTLAAAGEPLCLFDQQRWGVEGDFGMGNYFGCPDDPLYNVFVGLQLSPTFPIVVDEARLPLMILVPPGHGWAARYVRLTNMLVGYIDTDGVLVPEPVDLGGTLRVAIHLRTVGDQLEIEGYGVDVNGQRVTGGEAFIFCRACLNGQGGPARWTVTSVDGRVINQWNFTVWVPRTAEDERQTTRLEVDRLRREAW